MLDIRDFINSVRQIVARHNLGSPGAYQRWCWLRKGQKRRLGLNEYGCADAANILYTMGDFPSEPEDRAAWIRTLRSLQDPESGMFTEGTHHPIHTTAHCIAALELFDARPSFPLAELAGSRNPDAVAGFLEGLAWRKDPWNASHQGAGLYVALTLSGAVSSAWADAYFGWLWEEADAETGLFRKGCVAPIDSSRGPIRFPHLAGTFHYLFNMEYARQPLRYPSALIDTCLGLRESDPFPLGTMVGFAEVDWVYCLNRASRQSAERFDETRAILRAFAEAYVPTLTARDPETDEGLNDLHMLFGALCCLAELQTALPGFIRTEKPLRLVLDRRPFI